MRFSHYSIAPDDGVDLDGTENFAAQFLASIRDENVFVSTAEDGRIPFISADDIADVVFDALVDEKSHNTDHIVVGPELYTYDEVGRL